MQKLLMDFEKKFYDKTPAFIFDLDILEKHLKNIRKNLENYKLCFAMKANPILTEFIEPFVDKIEVCSEGEFQICKEKKIPAEKIFYTGVNKSIQGIQDAWDYGVRNFNAESINQILNISSIGNSVRIYTRICCQQFGIDESIIDEFLYKYRNCISGIHYFGGTCRDKYILNDIDKIKKFILNHNNIKEIEYGVGLSAKYFKDEKIESDNDRLKRLNKLLKQNFSVPITIELGRFICAKCGYYVSKVCDIKQNLGVNYAVLDGGFNHLDYFGQILGMKEPILFKSNNNGEAKNWCLCGSMCSMSDIIVRQTELLEFPKIILTKFGLEWPFNRRSVL